jgi:hypothetical protein
LKPRDENPEKYSDNVRKSWLVMSEVVRQIKNECYIAHLEPNPGVGYDCWSLVVPDDYGYLSEKHGYMTTKFMLNRNGQNGLVGGTVIRDIWETCDTDTGIKKFASDLIEFSGLTRLESGQSQSVMFRVCEAITNWISEQPDGEVCVAPFGWPGGCRIFEPECDFPIHYDDTLWPTHLGEPYLSLGVRHEEVARIRMTDASIRFNKTETEQKMYADQENIRKEFGTDYLSALKDWGGFKDEPGVIGKVTEIVRFVENKLGPVTLAYVVDSAQYVAIRFTDNPVLGIVFVNKGFVDHRIEIPGSVKKKDEEVWRTELPTSKNSAATHHKIPEIKQALCENCQMSYPAHLSACPICTGA